MNYIGLFVKRFSFILCSILGIIFFSGCSDSNINPSPFSELVYLSHGQGSVGTTLVGVSGDGKVGEGVNIKDALGAPIIALEYGFR